MFKIIRSEGYSPKWGNTRCVFYTPEWSIPVFSNCWDEKPSEVYVCRLFDGQPQVAIFPADPYKWGYPIRFVSFDDEPGETQFENCTLEELEHLLEDRMPGEPDLRAAESACYNAREEESRESSMQSSAMYRALGGNRGQSMEDCIISEFFQ